VKKWYKFIKLDDARRLSKIFCENFNIQYCEIYYVDKIQDDLDTPKWKKGKGTTLALYSSLDPPHILVVENVLNPIGVIIHELTHHLEVYDYEDDDENIENIHLDGMHGYFYQLAKKRVITWCKKNISDKANWNKPLMAIHTETEMRKFRV
jgi:hypothetical protein